MTTVSKPPHIIGVVEHRGVQKAAVLGLLDLLTWADRLHEARTGRHGLEAVHCKAPWPSFERPPSAVVVPPSLGTGCPSAPAGSLVRWLRDHHAAGTVMCSVCVGAFALAGAGVLEGRPATTHWALGEQLAAQYPGIEVDVDQVLIDDGDVITAGGVMAWSDLGLHLVERFLGPVTMLETARFFLVDPGGREQRFYRSFSPVLTHGDAQILRVQRWLQKHLAERVDVPAMARRAGLGERTFLRRFQKATGLRTREYVQQLRVGKARELLGRTTKTLQEVAWAVGYEDPGAFRSVFVDLVGLSPAAYRKRLGSSKARTA